MVEMFSTHFSSVQVSRVVRGFNDLFYDPQVHGRFYTVSRVVRGFNDLFYDPQVHKRFYTVSRAAHLFYDSLFTRIK